ncbi:hypothetical protein Cgig2_029144 [Carnegiea gigantea]|uniref:GATA-type domain-containing protein n=1 Tax=Carnegiea gigantea TaxID=171969 RepID=A0A9Q1KJY4_9CARY|nr:hypothetical protein Cgig2_029144 [Carnegiea gigantea]
MADLNHKRSDTDDMNNKYPDGVSSQETQPTDIKRCADCGTSKTPLWRGGPAGPKVFPLFLSLPIIAVDQVGFDYLMGFCGCDLQSLCNACGIRSRKKRRAIMGLKPEEKKPRKNNSGGNGSGTSTRLGSPLHQRLIALARDVMMHRSTVDSKPHRRKLGEEEQAAVLLMALSNGSVYAW